MTDKTVRRLEIAAIAVVFGAGSGWGAFETKLGALVAKVDRIDQRVAEMYCGTIPETQRAGCR